MEMYGEMGPSGGTGHSLNHNSGLGGNPHFNNDEQDSYSVSDSRTKENKLAQQILEDWTDHFHMRDYFNIYADRVVQINSEFMGALYVKERLVESQTFLEEQQITLSHTLNEPGSEPMDILQVSLVNAQILKRLFSNSDKNLAKGDIYGLNFHRPQDQQQQTRLRIYMYVDDQLQYKSDVLPQSNSPIIDLRLKISIPENIKEIRFDMYDASNLSPEDLVKLQEDQPEVGVDGSIVQEEVDDDQLQFPGYEQNS